MDSKIRPAVPMTAKKMVSPENTFSITVVFGTSLPRWRNQRSERKEMSRNMVVMTHPVMNSGLSF